MRDGFGVGREKHFVCPSSLLPTLFVSASPDGMVPGGGESAAISSCSAAIAIVGVMIATAAASYLVGERHGRLHQQQQEEEEDYYHHHLVLDGRSNDIVGIDKKVIEGSKQKKLQQRISAELCNFFGSLSNNRHQEEEEEEETKEGSSSTIYDNSSSSINNNNKDEMTFQIDRHVKQHVNDDDDDDEEVCIVEIVSPMECISRVKSAAEIKNEIIVISDDDDETVTHVTTPTPSRGVKIKIEPNNYNANVAAATMNNMNNANNNSAHPTSSILILPPIQPIATLSSVYRLCVGTPRQGMLVPNSRGIITFDTNIVSRESILELEGYSHVYVLFAFHLNNNLRNNNNSNRSNDNTTTRKQQQQLPSKIAPPSLGGKKVGIFATRTPHRPNPIGISLCKLDRVIIHGGGDVTMKGGKKSQKFNKNNNNHNNNKSSFSLLLSGLDLVDGTPIIDIKPYVPHYDCVGYVSQQTATTHAMTVNKSINYPSLSLSSTVGKEGEQGDAVVDSVVKVPNWVESGLQKRRNVTLLHKAKTILHQYQDLMSSMAIEGSSSINCESSSLLLLQRLQFYGPLTPWNDTPQYAIQCLERCIIDTLSCDVRSAWQTDKARKGKFQAERSVRLGGGGGQGQQQREGDDNTNINDVDINDDDRPQRLCTQQIDNVLVSYTIGKSDQHNIDERSEGSGAEDVVVVHTISFIE